MKYKLEIGLICFLLLFFISIDNPLVYVGGILRRVPNLDTPAQYACAAAAIPREAHVLFLSRPDGTLDWNAYNFLFSKAQYELVPRVLSYSETTSIDVSGFPWWIALNMQPPVIDQLAKQHGLHIAQTCSNMTILSSSTAPGNSQ